MIKNFMSLRVIRLFDIVLSAIGLLLVLPLLLAIFILSLFDTGRPIFMQERLGRDRVPFTLYKFRTMYLDTTDVATHLANPSAITKFGRFLRRSKLDELPQLWNVLKGEMSLVGPRPGMSNQAKLTEEREKYDVFAFKPGVTGLAQVSGIDMSTPELLAKTDARMNAEMSVFKYFRYIFLTLAGKGTGDGIK